MYKVYYTFLDSAVIRLFGRRGLIWGWGQRFGCFYLQSIALTIESSVTWTTTFHIYLNLFGKSTSVKACLI